MTQEIVDAVKMLEQEKGIAADTLMDALQDALLSAYKKTPGAAKYAKVELDHGTADFRVYELMVPEDLEKRLLDEQFEDQLQAAEAAEAAGEPIPEIEINRPTVDPETGERREASEPEVEQERLEPYMDQIRTQDVTPDDFGRIAAQTAKQVILQRIREAERGMMFEEYKDRVGELVTGIIQQSDNRYTLVQLRERVEALLPRSEQVYNERYDHGMRVKAVITDVSADTKGPSIVVSRRNPELIKKLFELEVPEIADKLVEITGVAREPGWRSKIAVVSHADGVDPVGACVGPRGSRVRMVVSELRGEKIDIIPYNEEPARFVAKALSPARVREVLVDDDTKEATVIVPDDQLSLAIGRDGQNARLAARLTGWKVDITSETEFAQQEEDIEYEGEEAADGRCMAIMTTGRRCPNAALQGSQYCGLPQHQALARFGTNQVAVLTPLTDEEVATLADSDADAGAVKPIVEKAEGQFDESAEAEEPEAEVEEEEAEESEEVEEAPEPEEGEESEEAEEGEEPAEEAEEATPVEGSPAAEVEEGEETEDPEETEEAEEPSEGEEPEEDEEPEPEESSEEQPAAEQAEASGDGGAPEAEEEETPASSAATNTAAGSTEEQATD
jgi:transcription termination/antitermination protein NusA